MTPANNYGKNTCLQVTRTRILSIDRRYQENGTSMQVYIDFVVMLVSSRYNFSATSVGPYLCMRRIPTAAICTTSPPFAGVAVRRAASGCQGLKHTSPYCVPAIASSCNSSTPSTKHASVTPMVDTVSFQVPVGEELGQSEIVDLKPVCAIAPVFGLVFGDRGRGGGCTPWMLLMRPWIDADRDGLPEVDLDL